MRTPKTISHAVAWIAGVLLLVLHLDFWREQRVELYWDWLPEELMYRVVWLLLAWGFLLFFCHFVWREDDA